MAAQFEDLRITSVIHSEGDLKQRAKELPILQLPEALSLLEPSKREVLSGLFEIDVSSGNDGDGSGMIFPESMQEWVVTRFKNEGESAEETLERMSHQAVLTVINRWTKEGAIYNPNRFKRPRDMVKPDTYREDISKTKNNCSFCSPEERTPETVEIGRLKAGDDVNSFANLTKFAKNHEIIAGTHDPFEMTEEVYRSQIAIGQEIARMAYSKNNNDPKRESKPHFVMIGKNQGPDAGASLLHDHAQVAISAGTMHFAEAERWHEASMKYRSEKGRDFTEDWFDAHEMIGLGVTIDDEYEPVRVVTSLTPKKDFGIVVVGPRNGESLYLSDKFVKVCWEVQKFMMDELEIEQFNTSLYFPPLGRKDGYWDDFRPMFVFVRRVRGDMGMMESAGTPVISADPKSFAPQLFEHLKTIAA